MAASSSTENPSSVPVAENPMQYYLYPPPIAQYEDVIASPNLFMDILGKFHAAMGTKFKIPIVGGKDLDLHRLFMEVTSRGGIKKVLDEKKWREVTNCFSFPPSATNASFILRKYYMSLVHHFEQVYYFKAKAWTPVPTGFLKTVKCNDAGSLESSIGLPVTGVLDGKFESGYLCTVVIGGERLQGVLYQTVQTHTPLYDIPKHGVQATMDATATVVRCRRRRRKKSEIRKRDPAHPKPNRSGYNFFFAEQHARLKLLHTAKDRAISRMIGEEWNKLTESEKAEKAVKDKERYKSEMANYKESFKREQVLTTSTPLQQQYFVMNTNMEINGANSHKIQENEPNSEYLDDDDSSFEGDGEETTGKVPNLETGAENSVDIECKQSLNIEDYQAGQQKSTPVPQNEPLVFENELTRIQENNLNLDKKSSDDEPMIPDINDENKRKSGDQQEQDLEMFDENGPLVTNEQRDLEIPR
ncbi:putative transcription factor & chromatin remodeling ARID-HMG family [Helianthus annuus]|nr:putative transcription factor & chromatin remodeling ARID-HMG family [Helianthus annuus]